MRILVTGGAGFIGSHFIELLLARGAAEWIVCLDSFNNDYDPALKCANLASSASDPRLVIVPGSLADRAMVSQLMTEHEIEYVMHLGAHAGVRASFDHPQRFHDTNVGGTQALLEAVAGRTIERFVFVSSSTVYGRGAEVPFREDAPLGEPLSPYGASKREAERVVVSEGDVLGIPVVCVRPFSVYGPRTRQDLAISVFARAIAAARPLPLLGDGSIRRDFTHVSDLCAGLLAALTSPRAIGQAINLGHHEPVAIAQLIALLETELGARAIIDRRPAFAGDMPITCADLTKARNLLGYQPKISLTEGVRDFVDWFRRTPLAH
ncbi:MAG TPA: GDP-mannose 4,6-dehydratase [Pirellulales bacterium]|nr:GDP-mannose 4,6-dehydratase [Pirellulales bacterium]